MAKPPTPAGRGRPPRRGQGSGKPRSSSSSGGEGPPWKRRSDDDAKVKKAGWGGVARKGAGRMRDAGPGDASKAFRAASPEGRVPWEPEVWVDEGEVEGEARRAVGRGKRRPDVDDGEPSRDPSLQRSVSPERLDRVEARLKQASRDFRKERFEEARRTLKPMAEAAPTAESVRELLGLTYYRLGRWKLAVVELEAFRALNGSTEQHPVLADCYRALGRPKKVAELWEELRHASPSAALVAEGRIVYAGSLADQGRLDDAIGVLSASKPPSKRPQEHHLRVTYALADLHERAGDVPKARQLFRIVASADPDLGDVEARLRALR